MQQKTTVCRSCELKESCTARKRIAEKLIDIYSEIAKDEKPLFHSKVDIGNLFERIDNDVTGYIFNVCCVRNPHLKETP